MNNSLLNHCALRVLSEQRSVSAKVSGWMECLRGIAAICAAVRFSIAILGLSLFYVPSGLAQGLSEPFWESCTDSICTPHEPTQDAAVQNWLQQAHTYVQYGSCGALGTSNYSFCPIAMQTRPTVQYGTIDVSMGCPGASPGTSSVSPDGLTCSVYYISADPPPNTDCGCTADSNPVSDPITPANSGMTHHEIDFASASQLSFSRFYNSRDTGTDDLSLGWRHSFSRKVITRSQSAIYVPFDYSNTHNSPLYSTPSDACQTGWASVRTKTQWPTGAASFTNGACAITQGGATVATLPIMYGLPQLPPSGSTVVAIDVTRDDGQVISFRQQGTFIVAPQGITLRLQQTGTGFQLTTNDDDVELYDANGHLLSVTSRSGVVQTMGYDTAGRLNTVIDSFGQSITLAYDSQQRLSTATDAASHTIRYSYDTLGRLASVTNADGTTRSYVYENAAFPNYLTGLIDESATRYSTWGYDSLGRATSTSEAGGAGSTTVAYNTDGSLTVTDVLGAVRTFTFGRYGDRNLVTAISGSQCPTCRDSKSTTYDGFGFVNSRTDYNGNVTCYANDAVRGLELVRVEGFAPSSTCPSNLASYSPATGTRQRKTTATWHSSFRVPLTITEANRTTSFTYDANGNPLTETITDTSVTPNVSRTWTYTYNSFGQVLTLDGPRTDVADLTTYAYYNCTTGAQCGRLQTMTNAAGQITTYNTYNASGQPLTITDPNGVVTTLTYDARQRLTSRQVGSEVTTFAYWPTGLLKMVTLSDGSYLLYSYDAAHRLTQVSDAFGNSVDYALDALGNRTAENVYDPSNILHRTHTRVFNTLNQLYQDVNAAGATAVTTTFGYDAQGNQTSIAAPLARNNSNLYDELNRLKQITDPASGVTRFAYDANDNLTSVIDPRNLTTSYAYNGFGDLSTQTSPDTGTTTNTYDSAGNLATSTDARGALATYHYDALNRLTSVAYSLSGSTDQTLSFTYDSGTNGKGHLTALSDANHSMSWSYDALGRVINKAQTVGGITHSAAYGYSAGNLTSLTTPSGQTLTYGYNANHQVTIVAVNGTTVLNNVTYEPLGPVNGWIWGNGGVVSRTYDADGNISQISSGGETYQYAVDAASRITSTSNSASTALSWSYGYDSLDRLTSASSPLDSETFSYTPTGTRSSWGGTAYAQTISGSYAVDPGSNRITSITLAGYPGSPTSVQYDAAGNIVSEWGSTVTYNAAGRAISLSGALNLQATYNGLSQRISKTTASGTVHFVYDEAGHLLGEYDGSGALIEETVWLGDIPVATLRPNSGSVAIYYVHSDHLNAPRKVSRPSDNQLVWRWDTNPFAVQQPQENPLGTGRFSYNLRFPGQYFDAETGLHYNHFRYYDPLIGAYAQSDPIGLAGGINTYAYVGGNPISFIDPFGLAPGDPYPTQDAAGVAAACDANGQSIKENREYAGFLYQNPDGTYSYTDAYPTDNESSGPLQALSVNSNIPTAWYHTHGAYDPKYGAGNFQYSSYDRQFSDATGKPNYLADPRNRVHRYDPDPAKRGRGRVHNYGQCGCSQ